MNTPLQFRMDLVKDGFAGGIRAAAELFELTQQYLQAEGLFGNGIIMCFIFLWVTSSASFCGLLADKPFESKGIASDLATTSRL